MPARHWQQTDCAGFVVLADLSQCAFCVMLLAGDCVHPVTARFCPRLRWWRLAVSKDRREEKIGDDDPVEVISRAMGIASCGSCYVAVA